TLRTLGPRRALGGGGALCLAASGCRPMGLGADRGATARPVTLTLQNARACAAPLRCGAMCGRRPVPALVVTLGLVARALGLLTWRRRLQLHPRAARLRKTNGDRLLRRACAVLALADVVKLLPDEFPRLGRGRFPLLLIALRARQCLFVWHVGLL